MKKHAFAVVKVGRRSWRVMDFVTLDRDGPVFEARGVVYHAEFTALAEVARLQAQYEGSATKCLHELAIEEEASSPRRFRTLCEVLADPLTVVREVPAWHGVKPPTV